MSDTRDEITAAETQAIEQALGRAMATGQEPRLLQGGAADAAAVREYTELLGLLPYSLDDEAPPARLREEIMGRVRDVRPMAPTATAEGAAPPVAPFPPAAPPARTSWIQVATAAMLGVCLLGLGFTGALVWKQDQEIDGLRGQLASTASTRGLSSESLGAEVRTLRQRIDMITGVARQAYPLRRVAHSDSPGQPEGIIYVCGNHQRWYLNLRGLEPPSPGEEYHLWFVTDDGKVDGGTVDVRPDAPAELEAMSMPDGTHGFLVTLERPRQSDAESLTVLLGETPINL